MKVNKLFIAFWLLSLTAFGQITPGRVGYQGSLTLKNQSAVYGTVYLDFEQKAVTVSDGHTLKAWHISQVKEIQLYDHLSGVNRQFVGIEVKSHQPVLFEKIISGELSLFKAYSAHPVLHSATPAVDYSTRYYVMTRNGEMTKISNFKKQAGEIFKEDNYELKRYADQQHYDLSDINHQVNLIRYYNKYKERQLYSKNTKEIQVAAYQE